MILRSPLALALASALLAVPTLSLVSVVPNARAFLQIAAEHGSFARWLWSFVDGRPVVRRGGPPVGSPEALAISKELKKRGGVAPSCAEVDIGDEDAANPVTRILSRTHARGGCARHMTLKLTQS